MAKEQPNLDSFNKLVELAEQDRREYDIEYRNNTRCDHCFHGLVALWKLGATTSELEDFYRKYVSEHALDKAKEPEIEINDDNWTQYLGQKRYYAEYRKFFRDKFEKNSIDDMLNKYVPRLISGMAGSAFHAWIHLGYALDTDCGKFVADGLAYLCYTFLHLGDLLSKLPSVEKSKRMSIMDILRSLENDSSFDKVLSEPNFRSRVQAICDHKELRDKIVSKVSCYGDEHMESDIMASMRSLFDAIITLFYNSNFEDFFIAHGITSFYATYRIMERMKNQADRLAIFYHFILGLCYIYVVQGRPSIEPPKPKSMQMSSEEAERRWKSIQERGRKESDVHIIKVVFVLHSFHFIWKREDSLLLDACEALLDKAGGTEKWRGEPLKRRLQRDQPGRMEHAEQQKTQGITMQEEMKKTEPKLMVQESAGGEEVSQSEKMHEMKRDVRANITLTEQQQMK